MKTLSIEGSTEITAQEGAHHKNPVRGSLFPPIRWSAVLAGVSIAISVQLVLMMLGVASSLALVNISLGEIPGAGALIWACCSMLIAAFVVSYVAGRLSGLWRKVDGMLHGVICWAVSVMLALILATTTGGSLISGLVSNLIQGGVVVTPSVANVASMLNRQLGPNMEPSALRTLQEYILSGRRDQAINYLNNTMNVQRERAATVIDEALILSGSSEQASPEGRAAAAQVLKDFRIASWTTFVAILISIVLSSVGGALGSLGAQRSIWNEASEGSSSSATQVAGHAG